MEHKNLTVAELRNALRGLNDDAIVLVMGIKDGDLLSVVGIDKDSYDGVVGIEVQHSFPDEWFYEDEEGSRWDTNDEA